MKKTFTAQQKAVVALTAMKGEKTTNEVSNLFKVHPTQVNQWKKVVQENVSTLFTDKRTKEGKSQERLIDDLYKLVGQRDVELDWLKKSLQRFDL